MLRSLLQILLYKTPTYNYFDYVYCTKLYWCITKLKLVYGQVAQDEAAADQQLLSTGTSSDSSSSASTISFRYATLLCCTVL